MDVTDLKKETANTEFKMTSMIQSIPGGICQVADEGEYAVLWYNDKFLEIIGYTDQQFTAELRGKVRYVHPDDMLTVAAVMQEAKRTGSTKTMEMRIVRRDGEIRTLMTTLSHMGGGDGAPVYYSVGIDITEYKRQQERDRKKLENALEMARQASQTKSRFLSRMSHEIRTPLNAVIGMTDIASRSEGDKKVLRNCLRKIDSAANYLLSLINDVLEVSRIESGKLTLSEKSFSLPDFLYDIADLFSAEADRKQIDFDIDVDVFPEEQFWGDPLHLKQIFVNLLANAFKFTEAGGRISLGVRKLNRSGGTTRLEFSVADTGIGMKPEFLDRIFNAFEQETNDTTIRYGGSGLGLSICKHLTELMGGSIEVSSREGEGSVFKVRLPLDAEYPRPGKERRSEDSHHRPLRQCL